MRRQLSFQEYRNIDLTLFALMTVIFEYVIIRASSSWFPDQPFTVSLAAGITSIVYMRWGAWGGIHAALVGFVYCYFSGGTGNHFIIYMVGNLFSLPAVLMLKKLGYEKVRTGRYLCLFFPLLVQLLMLGGRSVVSIVLGASPAVALGFITTDPLSILFTLLIVWIVRGLDGIYENQKHYLLRIHEEDAQ